MSKKRFIKIIKEEEIAIDLNKLEHFPFENAKKITVLERMLRQYWAMGGDVFFGPLEKRDEFTQYYKNGCIFYNEDLKKVFVIQGDIYECWKLLKTVNNLNFVPNSNEIPCADSIGRLSNFNGGTATIMWSPNTGAHAVWGDIWKKWTELGWERSYLGYPTCSEEDFGEGGRVNTFQGGAIYWWPDTGAMEKSEANEVAKKRIRLEEAKKAKKRYYVSVDLVSMEGQGSDMSEIYGTINVSLRYPNNFKLGNNDPESRYSPSNQFRVFGNRTVDLTDKPYKFGKKGWFYIEGDANTAGEFTVIISCNLKEEDGSRDDNNGGDDDRFFARDTGPDAAMVQHLDKTYFKLPFNGFESQPFIDYRQGYRFTLYSERGKFKVEGENAIRFYVIIELHRLFNPVLSL